MLRTKKIKISKDFSKTPKGREENAETPNSGQRFREELLQPIWEEYDEFIIDLDDLYGCPSSFREEAFGGLVREIPTTVEIVLNKLTFLCTDEPPLIDVIINNIKGAGD